MLTWRSYDDMAVLYWQIWVNGTLPRGTPLLAYGLLFKILWSPWDSNPGPPTPVKALVKSAVPTGHTLILVSYMYFKLFELI
jgi:hypothetical protein